MDDDVEREVKLHVYDLSGGMARQMSLPLVGKQIDGIWHTGVVLGDREYFFGGGIQVAASGHTLYGSPVETIDLGTTRIPDDLVNDFLEEVSGRYSAETYSLFHNNCNNFSDELATFLTGKGIPEHITGLPREFLATPMGQMLMPMLEPLEAQIKAAQGQALFPQRPRNAAPPPAAPQTPASAPNAPVATPTAPLKGAGAERGQREVEAEPSSAGAEDGGEGRSSQVGAKAPAAAKSKAKEDFEEAIRLEFSKLMSGGSMTANEAAAAAVKAAAARARPKA